MTLKKLVLAGSVVSVVVAYVASAWLLGGQVESALNERYASAERLPNVKIVKREYHRGLLVSHDTVTVELFGDALRELEEARKASGGKSPAAANQPSEPLRLTVVSEIFHGPFAGFSEGAAAVVDSDVRFDERLAGEIAKLFGDRKPLTVHTAYRFDGSASSAVSSPGFVTTLAGSEAGAPNKLSWDGIRIDFGFESAAKRYTARGDAPKLEIGDDKGSRVTLSGLHFEGEQQRVFDDEPLLFSGTQKLTIERIEGNFEATPDSPGKLGTSLLLEKVAYDIGLVPDGEFLDLVWKTGAEVAQVDGRDYAPARLEMSLKHLHARTVAKLNRSILDSYSNATPAAQRPTAPALDARVVATAMELLVYDPQLGLDRISFMSPDGEARCSLSVKLKNAKVEDFASPALLVPRLDASAELAIPVAPLLAASGERADQVQAILSALVQQGYVSHEGGLLRSRIVARGGQITFNGKALDPAAMAGGAGAI